jgi:hypothetical protein
MISTPGSASVQSCENICCPTPKNTGLPGTTADAAPGKSGCASPAGATRTSSRALPVSGCPRAAPKRNRKATWPAAPRRPARLRRPILACSPPPRCSGTGNQGRAGFRFKQGHGRIVSTGPGRCRNCPVRTELILTLKRWFH